MTIATRFEPTDGGLVLTNAILLYRTAMRADDDRYAMTVPRGDTFASIHAVEHGEGQPTIAAGTPLTRAQLRQWTEALGRTAVPEILPDNVLVAHPDVLAWWTPAKMRIAEILTHLRAALPNEAAAFVIWNEATGDFAIRYPAIDQATPSRLVYRTPALPAGWHLVCDIHSHGRASAFFSATDDADDAHATKIAIVFGNLAAPDGPTMATRLCAGGMFLPLPRSPFAGDHHAE
ncbi:MAG: PRTRC system protein A [Sphingomonas sp.]|uniref:PRTRC system protein A n=1 Tax=Sphingomonas sp. TaxID=28214 RepID=UPI00258B3018|nr:PRTRC system protein A [Sphingomonas sp.]MCP4025705.1 PRTRC system protein A [Sphingomonas sp.]